MKSRSQKLICTPNILYVYIMIKILDSGKCSIW